MSQPTKHSELMKRLDEIEAVIQAATVAPAEQVLRRLTRIDAALRRLPDERALLDEYAAISQQRLERAVHVHEPLVLISQIQRSGGTLLSQLFDGHPQCHAHPHELTIGFPQKENWPRLDLNGRPKDWYTILSETRLKTLFRDGYAKFSKALSSPSEHVRLPFLLPPRLQRDLFLQLASTGTIDRERDILDRYMTSFFNAWLDYQSLYASPKRIVTAFTPRLVMSSKSVEGFFQDYPDGWLLSMIREPKAWYASARRHKPTEYGDVSRATKLWLASARSIVEAKGIYGDRVIVLEYERLVDETGPQMRRLAKIVGISFEAALLTPTFNGRPIRANSSFEVAADGVNAEPLHRADELDRSSAKRVDKATVEEYERVRALLG